MIQPAQAFSSSYREARARFCEAAARAGATLEAWVHPLAGRDGEELAIDVARCGPADAADLLIVSSGCHGVEGYCGSGVQVSALCDAAWRSACAEAGVTVLYVHAINPWGFSWWRRVTHENIDLNRNFQDFSRPLPGNPAYAELHHRLLPAAWPPSTDNERHFQAYVAERGMAALQAAVSAGQHDFADGLFYGGRAPAWSHVALRRLLRQHAGRARRIAWVDLHTGLGPMGVGELGYAGRAGDAAAYARAVAWWGGPGGRPITRLDDGSSVSAPVTGLMWAAIHDECPQAETTSLAIEFGTRPLVQVLDALRAEQWLANHPETPAAQAAQIKADLLDAFFVQSAEWQAAVRDQALQVLAQAVDGLRRSSLLQGGAPCAQEAVRP